MQFQTRHHRLDGAQLTTASSSSRSRDARLLKIAGAFVASLACVNQAMAADSIGTKIPQPLPHMQDIKTPANSSAVKTGARTPLRVDRHRPTTRPRCSRSRT